MRQPPGGAERVAYIDHPRFRFTTIDEFLLLEESSPIRHEYVAGEWFAFAAGTDEHSLIATSIAAALVPRARGTGCRLYGSDRLLRIAEDAAYYPDVMVVCDPADIARQFKSRPCLNIEVLSESRESTDRREKLMAYRRIETLRPYLLVHQITVHVERIWLDEYGAWQREHILAGGRPSYPAHKWTSRSKSSTRNCPIWCRHRWIRRSLPTACTMPPTDRYRCGGLPAWRTSCTT
jgi:Uma2 family endonuclease